MKRICGLCGEEAAGYASVWSAKLGETWFCHGDDDSEPTCYERGQSSYMGVREGREKAAIDLVKADGDHSLTYELLWKMEAGE